MAKAPKVSHRNCAWCSADGICVPAALHQSFEKQLGPKLTEFDLFSWYERRTRERKAELIVVGDVWTTWREEFKTEIAFRGWSKPAYRPSKPVEPVQASRMATFGRSRDEITKHLEQFRDYKLKQAGSE